MSKVNVIGIELGSLVSIIRTAVASELNQNKMLNQNASAVSIDEKVLSREECSKMLEIGLTTLWRLDKEQILPSKRIRGKVVYLKSDVLNYLNNVA